MNAERRMIEELRKAYDMMTPEQLDAHLNDIEDIEIEPLSGESKQRIRNMISEGIKNSDAAQSPEKSRFASRRWVAAAAAVLVFVSVAAFSSEAVMAAVAKLFGFAPGIGVVDADTGKNDMYILDDDGAVYEDDMLEITLKGAFVKGDEMELRYTVYLKKITDGDLNDWLNDVSELYRLRGYDKYFVIADESPLLTPYTAATLDGREITADKTTVTETESLESVRTVCITQHYDLTDVLLGDEPRGTLSVGDVQAAFSLKKMALDDTVQGASGGQTVEVDGVKLLCVPTLKEDILYLDYYACELGEYKSTSGLRGWWLTDTLTVGGEAVEDVLDESCIFASDGTAHVGNRLRYDLSEAPDADEAVIEAFGLFVDKEYDGKGIFLDAPPTEELALDETVMLDGIEIKVAGISHRNYGEAEDYEELEHGYLEFRYSAESTDAIRFFVNFDEISINGETAEYFGIGSFGEEYESIVVPLSMPYDEVRSIEFECITLMLQKDITITIPLESE